MRALVFLTKYDGMHLLFPSVLQKAPTRKTIHLEHALVVSMATEISRPGLLWHITIFLWGLKVTSSCTTGSGVETAKVARLNSGDGTVSTTKRKPRERRVPSTPLGRVLGWASLSVSLSLIYVAVRFQPCSYSLVMDSGIATSSLTFKFAGLKSWPRKPVSFFPDYWTISQSNGSCTNVSTALRSNRRRLSSAESTRQEVGDAHSATKPPQTSLLAVSSSFVSWQAPLKIGRTPIKSLKEPSSRYIALKVRRTQNGEWW